MNYLKKIGKAYIYVFSILLISTFIFSSLNYINFIGSKFFTIIKIIIPIISLLIGGFIVGKNSKKCGWLEGIKFGGIFILFLLLFNFLALKNTPDLKTIIYYLIILISSTIGSMFGITKSKCNNEK